MTIVAGRPDTLTAPDVVSWAAQCFATEIRESPGDRLAEDLVAATLAVAWILEEHAADLEDEHGSTPCPDPETIRLVLACAATLIRDVTARPWCWGWDCQCADDEPGV